MKRVFNASNVLSTIATTALIMTIGFVGGENMIAAIVCLVTFAGSAFLALKEDGQIKK